MSQPVFVDASAWVAITNRKDANHKKSVQIFRRLLGSSTRLIANDLDRIRSFDDHQITLGLQSG